MNKRKTRFRVGQVVWDKEDCGYAKIHKISKHGDLLWIERFGNIWTALPGTLRPLTKREAR